MKLLQCVLLLALCSALLPNRAFAGKNWIFGKDDEEEETRAAAPGQPRMVRRYHLHIPDKKTEKELMDMFQAKKLLNEDIIVLRRLDEERMKQYQGLQMKLKADFGIVPEMKYQFDRESNTIYELVPEKTVVPVHDEADEAAAESETEYSGRYGQREFRKLESAEDIRAFRRLMGAKKGTYEQLRLLQTLMSEKRKRLDGLNRLLSAKFSLTKDRLYKYDEKKMTLYEILPASELKE